MKARELKETIARLESQIEENNVRLRRTRSMVAVMTEHLRATNDTAKKNSGNRS